MEKEYSLKVPLMEKEYSLKVPLLKGDLGGSELSDRQEIQRFLELS